MKGLDALNTYVTRYKARDGRERAVILWEDYEQLLEMGRRARMITGLNRLVRDLICALTRLGNDRWARIDARVWSRFFLRKHKALLSRERHRGKVFCFEPIGAGRAPRCHPRKGAT